MGASTASTGTFAALFLAFYALSSASASPSSSCYVPSFMRTSTIATRIFSPTAQPKILRVSQLCPEITIRRQQWLASTDTDQDDYHTINKNTQNSTHDQDIDQLSYTKYISLNNNATNSNNLLKNLFLGINPTPDIIAIATIYFVEGALGLARLAQTFLLKEDLHMGPAEMSATMGILSLPWTIKPIYGFLSDGFPIFGYKRRSYLVLAGVVGFLSYSSLAGRFSVILGSSHESASMTVTVTIISLILSSASIALADVVADGIVVQKTRDAVNNGDDSAVAGGLQSLCWGAAAIGGLISAYYSGSLLETLSPRDVFGIASILPLAVGGMSLLIEENPVGEKQINRNQKYGASTTIESTQIPESSIDESCKNNMNTVQSIQAQISSIWNTLRQPNIYKPILFIFLWKATPTSEGAMLYFLTNDIGFGPEFLGRVRLVTAASSLLGVWLYNQYLRQISIKGVLFWTSLISFPLGLTQLLLISHQNRAMGIPDGAFIFGDDVISSILGEMAFLPTLVLAARICPPGVEAVLFATLMSIYNLASTVGTELGAALTKIFNVSENDFSNLALLTFVCNAASLLPLTLIGWLDGVGDEGNQIEDSY